jgi:hypothetical protein
MTREPKGIVVLRMDPAVYEEMTAPVAVTSAGRSKKQCAPRSGDSGVRRRSSR